MHSVGKSFDCGREEFQILGEIFIPDNVVSIPIEHCVSTTSITKSKIQCIFYYHECLRLIAIKNPA